MSERYKAKRNVNDSKNTRLPIAEEFGNYRFGRDALAHVTRYLWTVEQIISLAKIARRPVKVIDIGCGDIYTARVFQASFRVTKRDVIAEYVGLDIDDRSLARSESSKPKSFPIELIVGDVTEGALQQFDFKRFDLAICFEVIEHIKPQFVPPLLEEIKRISNMAFISTPNFTGGSGRLPEDHILEWDVDDLTGLMQLAGYQVGAQIGTFCNLTKVRAICKHDAYVREIFELLEPRMDKHFLSLVMARVIGKRAQNVLHVCTFAN